MTRLPLSAALSLLAVTPALAGPPGPLPAGYVFPSVPADHAHARALLANCLRYADPANRPVDPVSAYPYEGWNQDPANGVYLRGFTQLTSIGLWMELLATVAAGQADSPHLPRDEALCKLAHLTRTLRQDQKDPRLGAKGLLGNFLDLAGGHRLGPLAQSVEKEKVLAAFPPGQGEAGWAALVAKGWLAPEGDGTEAAVRRGAGYGWSHFDGPLAPFRDDATRTRVMAVLDRRAVMVIFGDNANLSAAVGRTIGALLHPAVRDQPGVADVRQELDRFLDDQREGYARLFDPAAGLFYFGWDAGRDRLFGWQGTDGRWVTGHSDYLVNEFRGPTAFVVLRFGLPAAGLANLGFKMKPYRMRDGREVFALAPWEGSAFQALGLSAPGGELATPAGRHLLETAVAVEIDYSTRHRLPGFLSEAYTGEGATYTGAVGIPEITVSPKPRRTDAPSLYTLGPAYTIAPAAVERFLAEHWAAIEGLLTDHGPWEGYNVTRREPVRFQTTAHTLSLALGLLGTGPEHTDRYLAARGLAERAAELRRPGPPADLLSADAKAFAWGAKGEAVRSARDGLAFRATADRATQLGLAVVPPGERGVSLSGGTLTIRYRWAGPAAPVAVELKPAATVPGRIPTQVFARLEDTAGREAELRVVLPATPGLAEVREVVLAQTFEGGRPIDLTLTGLRFDPLGRPAPAPPPGGGR
jgi:hypothetical protein